MRVTATESWIRTVGWNACRRLQCRRRLDLDSQPRPHATGAFLFLSGREVEVAVSALGTKRTNRELCYLSAVGAKRTSARQQLVVIEEHPSTSERCCAAPLRFPDAARALRRSAAQDEWCRPVHSPATILPGRRSDQHSKPAGCASRQRVGYNIVRDRC